MLNREAQKWLTAPETVNLPWSKKMRTLGAFFDGEMTDDVFWNLSEPEQQKIRYNFISQNLAPHHIAPADRGLIGDLGSAVVSGLVGAGEMYANTVHALNTTDTPEYKRPSTRMLRAISDAREKYTILNPSIKDRTGVRRAVYGGLQSVVQSITGTVPEMAAGGVLGGIPGVVAGYALSGGTLFGVSAYDQTLTTALQMGIEPEIAKKAAISYGAVEGGFEFLTDVIEASTMGLFSLVKRPGSSILKQSLRTLLTQSWKQTLARGAVVVGSETGMEGLTSGFESEITRTAGMGGMEFWNAVKFAMAPAAVGGLIFATIGGGTVRISQSRLAQALSNPETDIKTRKRAAAQIGESLGKVDKTLSVVWNAVSGYAIENHEPIDIDADLYKKPPDADQPMGTTASGAGEPGKHQADMNAAVQARQEQRRKEDEKIAQVLALVKQAIDEQKKKADRQKAQSEQAGRTPGVTNEQQAGVNPATTQNEGISPSTQGLSEGQVASIQSEVVALGSPEAVFARYNNPNDVVDQYARALAQEIYGQGHGRAEKGVVAGGQAEPIESGQRPVSTGDLVLPETPLAIDWAEKGDNQTLSEFDAGWDTAMEHVDSIRQKNAPVISALTKELEALKQKKDKNSQAQKKIINKKIDELKSQPDMMQGYYEDQFIKAQEQIVDHAVQKALNKGLSQADVDDFVTEYSDRIFGTDPQTREKNFYRPRKQIFDELVAEYMQKEVGLEKPTQPSAKAGIKPATTQNEGISPGATQKQSQQEKEPWEMTRDDYVDGHITSEGMHKYAVQKALSEGKPVPAEVLADYPDLVKQYGNKKKSNHAVETLTGKRKKQADVGGNDPRNGMFPVAEILTDPERLQWRRGMGENGVDSRLSGVEEYDDALGGAIMVWRDPENNKVYVTNGHHRLAKAKELGKKSVLVIFSRETTAKEAKLEGALINIAGGNGTPEDVAIVFRNADINGEALEKKFNISLKTKLASDGLALSQLSDFLFGLIKSRELPLNLGIIIGKGLPNDAAAQQSLMALLNKKKKKYSADFVEQLISVVKGSPVVESTQTTLFGDETIRQTLALEKAYLLDNALKKLKQSKHIFGVVGKKANVAQLSKAGNIIDANKNMELSQAAAQAVEIINRLANSRGEIADLLNNYARKLHDAKTISEENKIHGQFYAAVIAAVPRIFQGRERQRVSRGTSSDTVGPKIEKGKGKAEVTEQQGVTPSTTQNEGITEAATKKERVNPSPTTKTENKSEGEKKPKSNHAVETLTGKRKAKETGKPGSSDKLALWIEGKLNASEGVSWRELFAEADKAFGGTQATGAYTVKDAYDAMELGVNRFLLKTWQKRKNNTAVENVLWLKKIISTLPTQTKRTDDMVQFQQYSTPPALAYVVNWIANISPDDVVLEPSAGVGGLAVFAKSAGSKVIVNELSPRRSELLKLFGFDSVFIENADQLNNILPEDVKPTVIVMNPPFSATAGRMNKTRTAFGAQQLDQALKRLEPGGRLVAIMGKGMAMDKPAFAAWWAKIKKEYTVRANVGINGQEYKKSGTSFDNQVIVIDKVSHLTDNIITGKVDKIEELVPMLQEVRNARLKQGKNKPVGEKGVKGSGTGPGKRHRNTIPASTGELLPGEETVGAGGQQTARPGGRNAGVDIRRNNELPGNRPGDRRKGTDITGNKQSSEKNVDTISAGGGDIGRTTRKPDRGRSELLQSESGELSVAELSSMIDDIAEEMDWVEEKAPVSAQNPSLKKAAKHAKTGAKSGLAAVADLIKGVKNNEVGAFGPNIPPIIAPEAYAKAKIHLAESYNEFIQAGKETKDWAKYALAELKNIGADFNLAKNWVINFYFKDRPAVSGGIKIEQVDQNQRHENLTESVFEPYSPGIKIKGAKSHPTPLVESAAMASVNAPAITYAPQLPQHIIDSGNLSIAQLEQIARAGQAHENILPNGSRKGFFIGDGTGVGKGREIAGIILDNFNLGRKKAVWISKTGSLIKDAKRDAAGVGLSPDSIFTFGTKYKHGVAIKEDSGVLFSTYSTLKMFAKGEAERADKIQGRIKQIVDWVGEDFDGVIAFDETHKLGNTLEQNTGFGTKLPSKSALAGMKLQRALPKARIVYVSATGATEVRNLAYAERLGLWGDGTPFFTQRKFINEIEAGGLAAMELVARDMKALGVYLARSLSYDGVRYEAIIHNLTEPQIKLYDELARAWQLVNENMEQALKDSEAGTHAKMSAKSQFWGAQQRFFSQVVTSLSISTVLKKMHEDLENGLSPVVQIVNTNEASQERMVSRAEKAGEMLETLDFTPRELLMEYLQKAFPVQQFEEYETEDGNMAKRVVTDSEGNPVLNQDAVKARDKLLTRMAMLKVPHNPLDSVLEEFGADNVAEVTGRKERFINGERFKRGAAAVANDIEDFQAGKKRILVFSLGKGGTGASYHADLKAKNQQQRSHYILQAGWRADDAVQGFGRTHRSNQAVPPIYHPVSTNLHGQKRFTSSIARRLDQLGAMTKGQRQTGTQGMYKATDNLETSHAFSAWTWFLEDLYAGEIKDMTLADFENETKLKLLREDENGNLKLDPPPMKRFLNRLLAMTVDSQNKVFDEFLTRFEEVLIHAEQAGTLESGLQNLDAVLVSVKSEQEIYTHKPTKATTKLVTLETTHKRRLSSWKQLYKRFPKGPNKHGFYTNNQTGKVFAVFPGGTRDMPDGSVVSQFILKGIADNYSPRVTQQELQDRYTSITNENAEGFWKEQYDAAKKTRTKEQHLLTGLLLPIWGRVPGKINVVRMQTDTGRRLIGRLLKETDARQTARNMGIDIAAPELNSEQMTEAVMAGKTLHFANKWQIKKKRVSGESRIEIIGDFAPEIDRLKKWGVFTEIISYQGRAFIPINTAETSKILEKIKKQFGLIEVTDAKAPKYATGRQPLKEAGVTNDDVRAAFANAAGVGVSPNGDIWVKYPGVETLIIKAVDFIDFNKQAFYEAYSQALEPGEILAGSYFENTIKLVRGIANKWTFAHEKYHWLEEKGFVPEKDQAVLKAAIQADIQENKWTARYKNNPGGFEDRAAWQENELFKRDFARHSSAVRAILQRMGDFVDGIANLFMRTSRGVIRDIESGKIFSTREFNGKQVKVQHSQYELTAARWYSQMEKVIAAKLPNQGTLESLKQILEAWARKGQFKQEELDWSGVLEWLDGKSGQVTKAEIVEWLKENNVRVEEVVKRSPKKLNYSGIIIDEDITYREKTKFDQYQEPGGKNYKELLLTLPQTKIADTYTGNHFEEPNILVHVRFNERTENGKKVLFIEEIQSDWHQAGREYGYGTRNDIDNNRVEPGAPPHAPFKKAWPMLAMKRMIRYAAENGFKKIAWTPGSVQADRYDLSKQVDRIHYTPIGTRDGSDAYYLYIFDKKGQEIELPEFYYKKEDLPGVVGKEITNKIIKGEGVESSEYRRGRTLFGLDLKVGGEGMKGFYDKILPAAVNKFVKKWGAKVGEIKIEKFMAHAIDITEAMKQDSLFNGMPQFAKVKKEDVGLKDKAGARVRYSVVKKQTGSPELTDELEKNRSFANKIFENRDVAVHLVQVKVKELQKQVQKLAGGWSRRKFTMGFAYDPKYKRSGGSDILDQALLVWRDLQNFPEKLAEFKAWAKNPVFETADGKFKKPTPEQKIAIKEQLQVLARVEKLTDKEKALADKIGGLFEEAYKVAAANKVVKSWRDNYVRRLWKFKKIELDNVSSSTKSTSSFKTFTSARMHRTLDTILDGWMAGYELSVTGLTNSYSSYMTELEMILANKDFVRSGYNTRDLAGNRLFSTRPLSGYAPLDAKGFNVWEWAGNVKNELEPDAEHAMIINEYGRKFFFSPPMVIPEKWAVYKDGKNPAERASKIFESELEAKQYVKTHAGTRIEHRPAIEQFDAWEQRHIYAPAKLAAIINKMTAGGGVFAKIPGLAHLAGFNSRLKSWILLSSFFHHMAGSRSWAFAIHHGWIKKSKLEIPGFGKVKTAGVNPISAYKMGLKKIEERHPLIFLGIKNGLTLGEVSEWSEDLLREQRGIARTVARKLGLEKADKVVAWGSRRRQNFTDSLFKRFFAGLKAEAFVMEYAHELQKSNNRTLANRNVPFESVDKIAERVARLINADFGGLHLKRMGRSPTMQGLARVVLLAPDWTESNFRTVTGMVPGLNKMIGKFAGDIPPPKGMERIYRRFWGRVAFNIVAATVLAQMMLNGPDDTWKFWKEQALSERFYKFRWTNVDITKIYRALGIETPARKTFSIGGHFFDPLKLFDPPRLIKAKGSPFVRIATAGLSGTDWAQRPFTSAGELLKTGKTIKKSPYQGTEGPYTRLPSTIINQVVNNQPIQIGYFLKYLTGEDDGLSSILMSVGAPIHNAWPPRENMPISIDETVNHDVIYDALQDLEAAGQLKMGPVSKQITIGGIIQKMTQAQYAEYKKEANRLSRQKLQPLIKSGYWKKMNDNEKARAVRKIIKAARKKARSRIRRAGFYKKTG